MENIYRTKKLDHHHDSVLMERHTVEEIFLYHTPNQSLCLLKMFFYLSEKEKKNNTNKKQNDSNQATLMILPKTLGKIEHQLHKIECVSDRLYFLFPKRLLTNSR